MNKARMGEIALFCLQHKLRKGGFRLDGSDLLKEIETLADSTNVSATEIMEFVELLVRGEVDRIFTAMNTTRKELDATNSCTDSSYQEGMPPCDGCVPEAEAPTEESQDPLLAPLIAGLKVILVALEDPASTLSAEERISAALGTAISEALRKVISDVCKPRHDRG